MREISQNSRMTATTSGSVKRTRGRLGAPQKAVLVTFACALLLMGCRQTEVVTRVVDGDTIVLASGKKVRYIGMDTPETVHPRKGVQQEIHDSDTPNASAMSCGDVSKSSAVLILPFKAPGMRFLSLCP